MPRLARIGSAAAGSFGLFNLQDYSVNYLAVAGGGGGGGNPAGGGNVNAGGGGGAGGLLTNATSIRRGFG